MIRNAGLKLMELKQCQYLVSTRNIIFHLKEDVLIQNDLITLNFVCTQRKTRAETKQGLWSYMPLGSKISVVGLSAFDHGSRCNVNSNA